MSWVDTSQQPGLTRERRRSPRIEILGRLLGFLTSLNVPIKVHEMSLGGMSIETPVDFPAGADEHFQLTLGDGSTVVLRARARHSRRVEETADGQPHYIAGFEFIDDDGAQAEGAIGQIIDTLT